MNLPQNIETPCYFYDLALLEETLDLVKNEAAKYNNFHVHYAVKANANPRLLQIIADYGFGADCVSGNEVLACVENGFASEKIVYAGVGKSDKEIINALNSNIFCFNCESLPEAKVINEIAASLNKKAKVALRINPNVDAHTHHYITTGMEENKFGFYLYDLEDAIKEVCTLENIELIGLHFHIGSQITETEPFKNLCLKVNEIQENLAGLGIKLDHVNFGGGLGIDYQDPSGNPIPDFKSYFETFNTYFKPYEGQQIHFELGRSIVCQCGSLISKVLYVKESKTKKFAILDAGMSDLIRPALYEAYHKIENITSNDTEEKYDVVGPICESSDCFGKDVVLNACSRGDLIALRSAGAYGEVMASQYNLRDLPTSFYSK